MNSNKKRPLLTLLLMITSLLVSIKIADVLAGLLDGTNIWSSGPPPTTRSVSLREFLPNSDTVVRPDATYLAGVQNLEDKPVRLRTDKDGYIVGPNGSPGPVDIVFLGGSTTECRYVDESLRFPYLVSRILGEATGKDVRSLNGGFSGSHSLHALVSLIGKGLVHRPKIVVLMENVNDLTLLTKTKSYWSAPPSRELLQGQPVGIKFRIYDTLSAFKDFLMPHLWNLMKSALPRTFYQLDEWDGIRKSGGPPPDVGALRGEFRSSLVSFIAVTRAWGSEPVLMTQFNRIRTSDKFVREQYESTPQPVSYDEFVEMYAAFNETIRDVAKETKVFLIDLETVVAPNSQYMYDSVHLNDAGSRLVANTISQALIENWPTLFARVGTTTAPAK